MRWDQVFEIDAAACAGIICNDKAARQIAVMRDHSALSCPPSRAMT
jgi:hypothetical protein